jgi:hypothetical protein
LFHFVGPLGLWSHDDDEDAEAASPDADAEAASPDADAEAVADELMELMMDGRPLPEAFPKKARTNDNNG